MDWDIATRILLFVGALTIMGRMIWMASGGDFRDPWEIDDDSR